MLGPEYLASLPEPAAKLWQQAEDDILRDIARRIGKAGLLTATAAWQAYRLEQTRAVHTDTEKRLAEYTGKSRDVIRQLLADAGTAALLMDDTIHRQAGKEPPPANQSGQLLNLLNAGYRQTLGTWLNLTATTANTVSGEFEHALSRAWLQVSSGAFDYNTAIHRAVDDLADRMAYVTYPSGHKDTLETAVRRAVLTGVNQTAGKLQMARAEEMGCEFVEVTAHEGARPTHALWQGRIYHIGGETDYEGQHYEDFVKATGYGTGAGLCGWNCRHNFYPFYPGISVRAYTDERLAELNAPSVEYRGKKYTRYEISQMQRAKERTVRKYKRRFLAESEAGLDTGTSAVRLKAARQDLKQFIRETGSKEDSARISVHGFGRSAAGKATWAAKKAYTNQDTGVILDKSNEIGVNPDVNFVCKIDKSLYSVVDQNLVTDEVIITEQQILHIEEGHPGDYARLAVHVPDVLQQPDYILRGNRPHTALVLKQISTPEMTAEVVLRLKVSGDPEEYKNSIITMWNISQKRFRRLLRQSEILYKKE